MNKRTILVGFFAVGVAVSFLFWSGSRSSNQPSTTVWTWGMVTLVFLGLSIWAYRMKDDLPDLLGDAGFQYFERDGFCFAVVPAVKEGRMLLTIWYQNRYAGPCAAEILIRPSCATTDACPLSSLTLRIECDGGGHDQVAVPWEATDARPNREIKCYFGVDVRYPKGCGATLRTRTGIQVASVKDVSVPELVLPLVTTGVLKFPFPEGVTISSANASAPKPPAPAPAPAPASPGTSGTTPSVIGSATVEVQRSGSRAKSVVCERCGHSYEYTLRREATGSGEDSDQSIARKKAEDAAQKKLEELLSKGTDVVPCPKCEGLTSEMRQEKKRHRKEGAEAMGAGVLAIVVGLGICGVVYLIERATHRLFYVIGIFGVGIAGFGVVMIFQGLGSAVTGEALEDRHKPKD